MSRILRHVAGATLLLIGIVALTSLAGRSTSADDGSQRPSKFRTLEELDSAYHRELQEIDRRRIADLSALAMTTTGTDADRVDTEMFHLAIARDLCGEAFAAAERCLDRKDSGHEARALASYVRILASADNLEFDRSFQELQKFLRSQGSSETETEAAVGVAEAYMQRLIRARNYDVARKLCEVVRESKDVPARLKEHFEARRGRLALLDKPAPALEGTDADGIKVALSALKGKVVLVDFWATWCPPNVAAIPRLNAIAGKYKDRDFEILGVNVDALHEDVDDPKEALAIVRRFLVAQNVAWTSLIAGQEARDRLKAYGVTDIPACVLIDREGKVIAIDLPIDGLAPAIEKALER